MPTENSTDSLDIEPALDKILKEPEKLDANELTLRDMSFRLTSAETVVWKLERETRKINSEINTMDAELTIMKYLRCALKLRQKKSGSINYT